MPAENDDRHGNDCSIDTMSKEKNLLDIEVEKQGVEEMAKAMTEEEIKSMPDRNFFLRHFRAEKGNINDAICKAKETLKWRKEFEVEKIVNCFNEGGDIEIREIISKENETGKLYVHGFDKEGRAALYMHPYLENTRDTKNNMRHLVYNLERAIACTAAKSGFEKINIMINYANFRLRDAPPLSTSRWTLSILQDHYPERLHKAYILNPGIFFRTLMTVIRPFLDPVTKEKVVLCGGNSAPVKVGEWFDLKDVEECAGGSSGNTRRFNSVEYLTKIPFTETF